MLSRTGPIWLEVRVFNSVTLIVMLRRPHMQSRQIYDNFYQFLFPSGWTQELQKLEEIVVRYIAEGFFLKSMDSTHIDVLVYSV